MTYKIRSKVVQLEQKRKPIKAYRDESDPENVKVIWEYEDIGWFVTFENSHESLFVGMTKPDDLVPGTVVEILIVPKGKDG